MSLPAGRAAEDIAARHLEGRGLRVIARNFRCRGGEIDLICDDRGTLVFVEVRQRRDARFGGAAASITAKKQARIVMAARHYLAGRGERACRFDALLIEGADMEQIVWLRDAFQTD